ncbi:phage tail protein [Allorhizobium undicola]|uniref:phage tail protein n=1 Tax=Allorhizobium undicola TaxID=78527 RepID=UPI00048A09E5|nr:tail fiber protein [Allorhizobium undicola]
MDAFLATILPVGFNFAPEGWQMCWGQQLAISQYTAVFSLISNIYGGNTTTAFNLPDLRGTMPVGYGQRPTSPVVYGIGAKGGQDSVTLTQSQMPAHTHGADFTPTGHATINIPGQTGTQTATLKASPAPGTAQVPATGMSLAAGGSAATKIYGAPSSTPVTLDGSSVSISGNAPTPAQTITTNAITGGAVTIQQAGGNAAIDTRPPFLAINFIFCVQGLYPVRS